MADTAIIRSTRIVLAVARGGRHVVRMLVVTEMHRRFRFLQGAIGRSRREGKLNRHEQEKEDGDEATHGVIMAELGAGRRSRTRIAVIRELFERLADYSRGARNCEARHH